MKTKNERSSKAQNERPVNEKKFRKSSNLSPKRKRVLKYAILIASLMVFAVVSVTLINLYRAVSPPSIDNPSSGTNDPSNEPDTENPDYELPDDGSAPVTAADHKKDFFNIILLGMDYDAYNTDTMMIVSFDLKNKQVNVLNLPRDTIYDRKGHGSKINNLYSTRGIDGLKSELKKLLGFDFDCYAVVKLSVFVDMVDIIGGVYFDVPQDMKYKDPDQDLVIDLKKGYQKLDGDKAMQLIRFRRYVEGDVQRVRVQQDFLKAVAKKLSNPLVLFPNLSKLQKMMNENMDTNLTTGNIAYFVMQSYMWGGDRVQTYLLPGEGRYLPNDKASNRESFYVMYKDQTLELVNSNFNPYTTPIKSISLPDLKKLYPVSSSPTKKPESSGSPSNNSGNTSDNTSGNTGGSDTSDNIEPGDNTSDQGDTGESGNIGSESDPTLPATPSVDESDIYGSDLPIDAPDETVN